MAFDDVQMSTSALWKPTHATKTPCAPTRLDLSHAGARLVILEMEKAAQV